MLPTDNVVAIIGGVAEVVGYIGAAEVREPDEACGALRAGTINDFPDGHLSFHVDVVLLTHNLPELLYHF